MPQHPTKESIMRFLLKAEMSVEAGNAAAQEGSLPGTIQSILDDVKPEAAYFLGRCPICAWVWRCGMC
jgi:hypothetical protein